jgi:thymidylate synthase
MVVIHWVTDQNLFTVHMYIVHIPPEISSDYLKLFFVCREVGDLGPVYGFQWRHFGAKYVDMHTDYTG